MILFCGHCQKKYEIQDRIVGQPDLEGISIRMGGRDIPGIDINICPECAIYALAGIRGFKRNGNIVTLTNKDRL